LFYREIGGLTRENLVFTGAFLMLVCLFANSVSALSLYASSGPYSPNCPVIVESEPGATISMYSMNDEYIGNCIVPLYSEYCVFSLNGKYGDGVYRITDGRAHLFASFSKTASCLNCFIDDKPYPRGMENPSNPNAFCNVSSPWAWSERPLAGVSVSPNAITVGQNQIYIFKAYGFDVNNNTVAITPVWSSSNTNVGTINEYGTFIAKSSGKTAITASFEGQSANASVEVVIIAAPDYEKILVLSAPPSARIGDTIQVRVSRSDGAPFANRTVVITPPTPRITFNVITDEEGALLFKAPEPGVYIYSVNGYSSERAVSTYVEEQPPVSCPACSQQTCSNQTNLTNQTNTCPVSQQQQPLASQITAYLGRLRSYAPAVIGTIIMLAVVFGYLLFVRHRAQSSTAQQEEFSPEKGEETRIWTVDDFEAPEFPAYSPPKTLTPTRAEKTKRAKQKPAKARKR